VAASGVQFSDKEREWYKQMFPSWFGSTSYNFAKIDGLVSSMKGAVTQVEKSALTPAIYDELKGTSTQTSGGGTQAGSVIEYNGKKYKVGANGELTEQ